MVSLSEIIRSPLGLNKLREMLPSDSKAMLYSELAKDNRPRQAIFKGVKSIVVLYETKIDRILQGHWIVLIPPQHRVF